MTVVARFIVDDWPMLFGDLLLSRRSPAAERIILPTTNDVPTKTTSGDAPIRLCQKIALVGKHIAIGWSGRLPDAQDIVYELRLRVDTEQLDMQALDKCLDRMGSGVWKDVSILGFVREPGKSISAFSRAARNATSKTFGNVRVIGFGARSLARLIRDHPAIPDHLGWELNKAQRAVMHGYTLSGGFLNIEIHTGENLDDVFGGGYEIATLSGDEFIKVGDATYVYWRAKYVNDNEIYLTENPSRVFRYAYTGDLLVIRSLEPISPMAFRDTVYPIPPVYRPLTEEEAVRPPVPDMNAPWLCNYVLIEAPGTQPTILTSITPRRDPTSSICFFEHEGQMVFRVDEAFLQKMRKAIKQNPAVRR